MKGTLKKTLSGVWYVVRIEEGDWETYYQIHDDDIPYCQDYDGKKVEFKLVRVGSKDDLTGRQYARVIPLDDYGYPLVEGTLTLCKDIKQKL